MGYLLRARRHFQLVFGRKAEEVSKWKEHIIPKKERQTYTQCSSHTSTVLFVSFNFSERNGLVFPSGHLRVERVTTDIHRCGFSVPTGRHT